MKRNFSSVEKNRLVTKQQLICGYNLLYYQVKHRFSPTKTWKNRFVTRTEPAPPYCPRPPPQARRGPGGGQGEGGSKTGNHVRIPLQMERLSWSAPPPVTSLLTFLLTQESKAPGRVRKQDDPICLHTKRTTLSALPSPTVTVYKINNLPLQERYRADQGPVFPSLSVVRRYEMQGLLLPY